MEGETGTNGEGGQERCHCLYLICFLFTIYLGCLSIHIFLRVCPLNITGGEPKCCWLPPSYPFQIPCWSKMPGEGAKHTLASHLWREPSDWQVEKKELLNGRKPHVQCWPFQQGDPCKWRSSNLQDKFFPITWIAVLYTLSWEQDPLNTMGLTSEEDAEGNINSNTSLSSGSEHFLLSPVGRGSVCWWEWLFLSPHPNQKQSKRSSKSCFAAIFPNYYEQGREMAAL